MNYEAYQALADYVNGAVSEMGTVDLIEGNHEHDGWVLQKQTYMVPNATRSVIGILSTYWTKSMFRIRIYTWEHAGVYFSGFNYNDQWYITGYPLSLVPEIKR